MGTGSRHDLLTSGDGCKDDNVDNTKSENCGPLESPSYEKRYYQLGQFSKVDANLNSSLFQPNEVNEKGTLILANNLRFGIQFFFSRSSVISSYLMFKFEHL